jgi:hypothetical protein
MGQNLGYDAQAGKQLVEAVGDLALTS